MRVGRINQREVDRLANARPVLKQEETVSDEILETAQNLAPFLTGRLRRSLIVVEVRNPVTGRTEYRIGWDISIADYGPAVELGTEDTPAQPHLRPAGIKVRGR
jgi:HK97 gp10 family phage protein